MDLKFEGVDLEYKKAKNNLPESFWDTYQRVNRLPAKL
ncbi:degenerate transposase [Streptococcus pneumoniae]|nr:degenerate transposase [Streptococcus pneumoniae]VJG52896.1 degenerate transposase [Streptococcus pneumoniae]VJI37206.1 degenerate transposase [Streptococcus pneumoniae]VJL19288.1 degenerate transposase [Streptococcus pneumoniae]VJS86459.1 degenerate transposase [Streptococcus pneumoniae]